MVIYRLCVTRVGIEEGVWVFVVREETQDRSVSLCRCERFGRDCRV